MGSNCKLVRVEIEESGGGAWLSRGAAEHTEACAGCLDFMNERESLRRLVGGLGRVEAPADFEFRLRARMAAAKEKRAARFAFLRPAPGLASYALAAVLVTSITAAYYFNRTAPIAGQPTSHQTTADEQTAAQASSPSTANGTDATNATTTKKKNETDVVADGGDKQAGASSPSNVERAAVGSPSRRERRRVVVARAVTNEPRAQVAKAQPEGVLEFGLSTSPVVKGTNVKLEVPAGPLRVVMRDERGTPRRLAMRPVSFGAQIPVGKRRDMTTTVADSGGVW